MSKRIWSFVGLLVIVGGVVVVLAAAAPASGPSGLSHAITVKDRHENQLFAHAGVVGVGVGVADGNAVIDVLAARANVAGIPRSIDGVTVVTRVSGRIRALSATARTARPYGKGGGVNPASYFSRPVPIGVSTGRYDECSAGTIGARVKSGSGPHVSVFALSASHVYAKDGIGASVGDKILQPGRYDSKPKCSYSSSYDLATLSNWSTITFSGDNTVDAAIAQTTTGNLGNSTPSNGYGTPSSTITSATVGMAVQKYGERSGLTHGSVCAIDVSLDVDYGGGMVAHFVHQFAVCDGGFSNAGDSGSLIVTDNGSNQPVGLLFAGGSHYTFANPIGAVLSSLGVTIDGS